PGKSERGPTRGGGASFRSPSGAPALDQAAMVAISASVSRASRVQPSGGLHSLVSCAPHGGMVRALVTEAMTGATSRAFSYVVSAKGARPPATWQLWQFRWTIGSTSL